MTLKSQRSFRQSFQILKYFSHYPVSSWHVLLPLRESSLPWGLKSFLENPFDTLFSSFLLVLSNLEVDVAPLIKGRFLSKNGVQP